MAAASDKSPEAYRTISEVAEAMDLPQHVLRFWETRFPQIKPLKRAGGRRYYRPEDVELLAAIKRRLYDQGYTIKGVQKMLREQGALAVIADAAVRPETTKVAEEAPPPPRREPSIAAGLSAQDVAALRAALADVREAERQLRQARMR